MVNGVLLLIVGVFLLWSTWDVIIESIDDIIHGGEEEEEEENE